MTSARMNPFSKSGWKAPQCAGVIPMLTDAPSSTDDMFEIAERKAVEAGLVESGDDIVIVAGVPVGEAVRTNTMRIRTVR